jgi:hypothetical protein
MEISGEPASLIRNDFDFQLLADSVFNCRSRLGVVGSFFWKIFPNFKLDLFVFMNKVRTAAFAILAFTLIFKILPDVHARWKMCWLVLQLPPFCFFWANT